MQKQSHCPKRQKIDDFLECNEDIPNDFMEHARHCAECHFWLSHLLAIQKASNTIPRNSYDNGCLAKIEVERLLRSAAAYMGKNDSRQKNTRELEGLEAGDPRLIGEATSHLKKCWLCMDYYRRLHDTMITAQEEYRVAMDCGENIRPVWQDNALERAVRGIHFIDTHSEKPN